MFIIYASEQLNYMTRDSPTKLPKNIFRCSTPNTMPRYAHMWRCCVHYLSVIDDLMTCYVQTKARIFMQMAWATLRFQRHEQYMPKILNKHTISEVRRPKCCHQRKSCGVLTTHTDLGIIYFTLFYSGFFYELPKGVTHAVHKSHGVIPIVVNYCRRLHEKFDEFMAQCTPCEVTRKRKKIDLCATKMIYKHMFDVHEMKINIKFCKALTLRMTRNENDDVFMITTHDSRYTINVYKLSKKRVFHSNGK